MAGEPLLKCSGTALGSGVSSLLLPRDILPIGLLLLRLPLEKPCWPLVTVGEAGVLLSGMLMPCESWGAGSCSALLCC